MIDKLSPDNFPLRAIGVNIYARLWSSPILVADMPETAESTVHALNEYARLRMRLEEEGPVLVTSRDMLDGNW